MNIFPTSRVLTARIIFYMGFRAFTGQLVLFVVDMLRVGDLYKSMIKGEGNPMVMDSSLSLHFVSF